MLDPDIQGRLQGLAPEHLMAVVDCLLGPQGGQGNNLTSSLLSVGRQPEKEKPPALTGGMTDFPGIRPD